MIASWNRPRMLPIPEDLRRFHLAEPPAAIPPCTHSCRPRWSWESVVLGRGAGRGLAWWTLAGVRIVRFHRVLRDVEPMPAEWQAEIDELAGRLGLRRAPTACLVPGDVPPMLWAVGPRARLLVPARLWATLGHDERTSLLLHELAHLKRRDHWVRWVELVVAGLYWWHPAVWWIRRALARGRGAVLRRLGRLGDAPRSQDLCRRAPGGPRIRLGYPDRSGRGRFGHARQRPCLLPEKEVAHDRQGQDPQGPLLGRTTRRGGLLRPAPAPGAELGAEGRRRRQESPERRRFPAVSVAEAQSREGDHGVVDTDMKLIMRRRPSTLRRRSPGSDRTKPGPEQSVSARPGSRGIQEGRPTVKPLIQSSTRPGDAQNHERCRATIQ